MEEVEGHDPLADFIRSALKHPIMFGLAMLRATGCFARYEGGFELRGRLTVTCVPDRSRNFLSPVGA